MKYNIGDLFVAKTQDQLCAYYPEIGYIIGIKIDTSYVESEELCIRWLGKFADKNNEGYYLPSQLNNYIHYSVNNEQKEET